MLKGGQTLDSKNGGERRKEGRKLRRYEEGKRCGGKENADMEGGKKLQGQKRREEREDSKGGGEIEWIEEERRKRREERGKRGERGKKRERGENEYKKVKVGLGNAGSRLGGGKWKRLVEEKKEN